MQSAVLRLALTAVHLSFGFAQVSSLTNVERDIMHYDNFGCGKQDVVKAAFRSVAHFGKDNIFPEICGAICHEPFVGIYKGECYCAEKIDVKSFEIGTTNCPPDQVTIFKSLDADKQDNRTDNINGTNIINGTSGTNGTNVVNGTGGTNGTNVVNGTSGTNGTNIVNGTSSTNGANIVNATHSTKAPGVINGTNSTNGVKEPQNTAQVNKGDANQNDNDNNDYVGAATENSKGSVNNFDHQNDANNITCIGGWCTSGNSCSKEQNCPRLQVICQEAVCNTRECQDEHCDRLVDCAGDECHFHQCKADECNQKIVCSGRTCKKEECYDDECLKKFVCKGAECKHENCQGDECHMKFVCEGNECKYDHLSNCLNDHASHPSPPPSIQATPEPQTISNSQPTQLICNGEECQDGNSSISNTPQPTSPSVVHVANSCKILPHLGIWIVATITSITFGF